MWRKHTVLAVFIGLGLSSFWHDASGQSATKLAGELSRVRAEADKLAEAESKAMSAAKTEADREAAISRIVEAEVRVGWPLAERLSRLISANPTDEAAVDAITWVLETYPGSPAAGTVAGILSKHHLNDEAAWQLLSRFDFGMLYWAEDLLRTAASADVPADRKRKAKFHLASLLRSQSTMPATIAAMDEKMFRAMSRHFGEKHATALKSADAARLARESLALFNEVMAAPGVSDDLSQRAKAAVYELESLAVGKPAPEITGEDIDGKPMKLSEYRGKVVVLDFWGHW